MSSNLAISLVIGASVGGAISAIRGLRSEISILRNSELSTSAKLGELGKGMLKGLSGVVSMTSLIGSSVMAAAKPAIQFESAMADVKKVVNFDTPEQFKAMEKDILKLTRTIPMASEEIAAIVAAGGQAGIAREHLLGYAEDAAKMGVAFDMAAGDAGTAMATMSNVLGKPINEMAKFGDAINHLSDNANSKAADIVNVITRAGSDTRMIGLTENQAAALSSTFLSMGKAPELAAQAIKGMTASFADLKAGKHAKELQMLGLSPKTFANAMNKDAQGAISDFIERVKKLPKDKQYPILSKMFGRQYADDVMLLAQNTGEYNRQLQLLQETDEKGELKYLGSMQREFESRSATTEANLQKLSNSFSELGITIGAKFLPLINNVIDDIKPVIYGIAEWIGQNQELVNQILLVGAGLATASVGFFALKTMLSGVIFAGFGAYKSFALFFKIAWAVTRVTAVLGVGLFDLGISFAKLFFRINLGIMKEFIAALKITFSATLALAKVLGGIFLKALIGVGKAFLFMGRAMLASPLGTLIAIGTIALIVYQYWEPIKKFFLTLWEPIKPYFDAFIQFIGGMWDGIVGFWSAVWDGVTTWFTGLWDNLKSLFSGNFSALGSIILNFNPLSLFVHIFSSVLNWFGIDLPAKFTDFGKNMIDGLVNGIRNAWEGAKQIVSDLGDGIKGWFKEKLGIHSPSRVFKDYGDNIATGLALGIADNALKATKAVDKMSKKVRKAAPKKLVAPLVHAPVTKSAVKFEPVLNGVESVFKPLLNEKKSFLGTLWDDIKVEANFIGNLLGLNQPTDFRTPDFNPNATGQSSIFSDYQPLNRQAVAQNETNQNNGIVVNFNPTIHVSENAGQGVMEQVQQGLNMSLVEFERLLNRVLDQRQRRVY